MPNGFLGPSFEKILRISEPFQLFLWIRDSGDLHVLPPDTQREIIAQ